MSFRFCVAPILSLFLVFVCCREADNRPQVRIAKFPDDKKAALSITFDDGCQSVFTKIVPGLNKHDLKATFYIIAGEAEKRKEWIKWNELVSQGHEVGNHSLSHAYRLGTVTDVKILSQEIDSSFLLMKKRMERAPFSFGQPFHSTSYLAENFIFKNHYASKISPAGFCDVLSLSDVHSFELKMEDALNRQRWIVTTAHGVDDCFNPMTSEVFDGFVNCLSKYKNQVFIETFENLAKYKIESENVSVSFAKLDDYYRVQLDTDLPEVFNYPLTILIFDIDESQFSFQTELGTPIAIRKNGNSILLTISPRSVFFIRPK